MKMTTLGITPSCHLLLEQYPYIVSSVGENRNKVLRIQLRYFRNLRPGIRKLANYLNFITQCFMYGTAISNFQ